MALPTLSVDYSGISNTLNDVLRQNVEQRRWQQQQQLAQQNAEADRALRERNLSIEEAAAKREQEDYSARNNWLRSEAERNQPAPQPVYVGREDTKKAGLSAGLLANPQGRLPNQENAPTSLQVNPAAKTVALDQIKDQQQYYTWFLNHRLDAAQQMRALAARMGMSKDSIPLYMKAADTEATAPDLAAKEAMAWGKDQTTRRGQDLANDRAHSNQSRMLTNEAARTAVERSKIDLDKEKFGYQKTKNVMGTLGSAASKVFDWFTESTKGQVAETNAKSRETVAEINAEAKKEVEDIKSLARAAGVDAKQITEELRQKGMSARQMRTLAHQTVMNQIDTSAKRLAELTRAETTLAPKASSRFNPISSVVDNQLKSIAQQIRTEKINLRQAQLRAEKLSEGKK